MADHVYPTTTPNTGIIQNPTVRKWAGNILGVATLVLSVVVLVDGAVDSIVLEEWTRPAAVIIAGLLGIFQLGVTSPNVPTVK